MSLGLNDRPERETTNSFGANLMDDVLPPLSYAPDGLYESDIDVLIAEYFTADEARLPAAISDHVATNRHIRRLNRQTVSAALRSRSVEPNRADDTAA